MRSLLLITTVLLIAVAVFGIVFAIIWQQRAFEESSAGNTDQILVQYTHLQNKSCKVDAECNPLNCIEGKCLVQRCKQDSDCPVGLWCGPGLHPAPGMCSKFPGAL